MAKAKGPEGGIVRCLDGLGRLVLPKEARRRLGWAPGHAVMIHREGRCIVVRSAGRGCRLCGEEARSYMSVRGAQVCYECVVEVLRDNHRPRQTTD